MRNEKMTLYDKLVKKFGKFFRRIYRLKVIGAENVPAEGSFILSCNHTALFDPVVLVLSIPRVIRFMAKRNRSRSR